MSDEQLLAKMQADLAARDYRFSTLVESIVTSPQFLNKRGRDVPAGKSIDAEISDD